MARGIFEPSKTTLQQLIAVSDSFDFAAFVFGADDTAIIRREAKQVTRDNVVFELGLFIGRLGSERCFVLAPGKASNLHLPTDLLGLTPATYDGERVDGNIVAGLGTACNTLRRVIKRIGTRGASPAAKSGAARVAAGIASEVREELASSRAKKAPSLDSLTQQFTDAVQGIATARSVDRSSDILKQVVTLGAPGVALCRALARKHLTQVEYNNLRSDPLGNQAVRELRRTGLLVPLADHDKAPSLLVCSGNIEAYPVSSLSWSRKRVLIRRWAMPWPGRAIVRLPARDAARQPEVAVPYHRHPAVR